MSNMKYETRLARMLPQNQFLPFVSGPGLRALPPNTAVAVNVIVYMSHFT